ncbi:MAG: hypothetical protein MUP76_10260, partial [Acidimicrobiia bacterium]|nr:hypothetical protein [Acidimicrobiia bacterium]
MIAFDLDGTLAVTKSAISEVMAHRLRELLSFYEVCVISGGTFEQFKLQVIDLLDVTLAVTKSAISEVMANRLRELLSFYEVCVISGGTFEQFKLQVIDL